MSKDAAALYRVRNWDALYENGITRKIRQLNWVATPNKHDGRGFRRLIKQRDGVALYGAWHLILQVASKMPKRGTLADTDGPLSPEDIADKTGAPAELISRALQVCSLPEVGWVEVLRISPSADASAERAVSSADRAGVSADPADASADFGTPVPTYRDADADASAVKEGKGIKGTEQKSVVVEVQSVGGDCTQHHTSEISDGDPIFPGRNISQFNTVFVPGRNDSGQALDQLARDLVNRLISKHWTASNAPAATGRLERILAEAVNPERVAASIEANHASWAAWHRAHPRERKKRLEYWLADGDYLHPVSGYAAAPAVPVIDEAPVVVEELSDEELAALDAQRVQERLQEALR